MIELSSKDVFSRVRQIAKSIDVKTATMELDGNGESLESYLVWDHEDEDGAVLVHCDHAGEDEILVLHKRVDFDEPISALDGEFDERGDSDMLEDLMVGRTRYIADLDKGFLTSANLYQMFPVCKDDAYLSVLVLHSVKEIIETAAKVRTTIGQAHWQDEMR
jgi:hypothetical protein